MNYGMVPPPEHLSGNSSDRRSVNEEKEKKYNVLTRGYTASKSSAMASKRTIIENDYFEQDSDEDEGKERRRESGKRERKGEKKKEEREEEDPLDAFMAEINEEADQARKESEQKEKDVLNKGEYSGGQAGRDDIDEEDMQESMMRFMDEYAKRHEEDDNDVYEYDEDGNIIWTWKKVIDPLPPMDHSQIQYIAFDKNFYEEHEEIKSLNPKQVFELRIALDIRVYGSDTPKPVVSFAHFQFDKALMAAIQNAQFEKPTPIQAQAVPAALAGRDILGLAKTGSGKTLAYIWPALCHIMQQPELEPGNGPIALVVVPTRELAIQVYNEARKFCSLYNISVVCAYGGGSKYEQQKDLEKGAELCICTPGRIIDLVKMEATNFLRTTFLIFDEVDRMFDLGFENQVKSIADNIRPDRQCLVFSATMKAKIEKLVVHALFDPIKIVCGDIGEANSDVEQTVLVLPNLQSKFDWLFSRIVKFVTMGKVLIFVTKKVDAEEVAKKLILRDLDIILLHGDMLQQERNEKISSFRALKSILVATDVAARGLDIPEIRNVVNFDVARDIDTHVHRVGRTGRAGHKGFAHTLVTEKDSEFCAHLVKNFETSGQHISPELLNVALKCVWFKAQHEKQQGQQQFTGGTKQHTGLGYAPTSRISGQIMSSAPNQSLLASTTTSLNQQPTISKQIERAKSLVNTGGVAGMDRVSMMRSALKSTFKHSFQAAASSVSEYSLPASDPRPAWKIKLDEQAEKINQALRSAKNDGDLTNSSSSNKPSEEMTKKRSRWT